mmetsp:Transcript_35306/g.79230  ORF Transcript_35306/g.79230 Transcript_35306/m.79230 type:complete len:81 (-) Transcript_35306:1247-1489(-)
MLGRAFFWSQACDVSMSGDRQRVYVSLLVGRRFLRLGSAAYSVGEGESPPSLYDCFTVWTSFLMDFFRLRGVRDVPPSAR